MGEKRSGFLGCVGVSTSRWKRRLWGMLLIARPVFSLLPRYQQWKKERGTGKTCNVQRCERKRACKKEFSPSWRLQDAAHSPRELHTFAQKSLSKYIPREFDEILPLGYVFLPLPTPRNFSWPGTRSADDRPTDQRGIALRRGRRKRIEEVAAANPACPENGAA